MIGHVHDISAGYYRKYLPSTGNSLRRTRQMIFQSDVCSNSSHWTKWKRLRFHLQQNTPEKWKNFDDIWHSFKIKIDLKWLPVPLHRDPSQMSWSFQLLHYPTWSHHWYYHLMVELLPIGIGNNVVAMCFLPFPLWKCTNLWGHIAGCVHSRWNTRWLYMIWWMHHSPMKSNELDTICHRFYCERQLCRTA